MTRRRGRAPISGWKPFVDEEFFGFVVEVEADIFSCETRFDFLDFEFDDLEQVCAIERLEDHDAIETVDEFGFETLF